MAAKKVRKSTRSEEGAADAKTVEARPESKDGSAGESCPVAGFGASAGGLEAFTEVLQHMPDDTGMAFVFIQHLDPRHLSVLTELLARSTRMPVREAANNTAVKPNCVYVIPPNSNLAISQGVLHLEPRPAAAQHMPVDHFFRSLAADQGSKAIGVVLSGTASDGTLGLKAIKAEGGITLAQSPDTAKYDGMPRSAIAAGCVDVVVAAGEMADELARLCRHPYLSLAPPVEGFAQNDREFAEIFAMLRTATGVDFSHYKPGTIRRRIERRMALQKLDKVEDYVRLLKDRREELNLLFQDLLINVTGFFREPSTFAILRSQLLPELFKNRRPEDPVRVWVPGCATGEEAYSVAICVLEYSREARIEVPIQIFGTDLNEAALEKARAGVYPDSITADVSPDRLRRFFVRVNGKYQIARPVRDICIFARQNVAKDPPFSGLDLVTCRNVLIYLGPVLQTKVMRLFHYALKPSGFLVLGMSETIGAATDLFVPIDKQHKIYRRKPAVQGVTAYFGGYDEAEAVAARRTAGPEPESGRPVDIHRRVDQALLARYSPPAIVVNKDLQILQFRGKTGPFLDHSPGDATLSVAKMTRGGLGVEIRKLVQKSDVKAALIKSGPIPVSIENRMHTVRISVLPIHGSPDPLFLVVFDELTPSEKLEPKRAAGGRDGASDRIRSLERELASTKQYLQTVIEEQEASTEALKSAHEEVQSSNEELQSTNEELLTAKEELQSTNEELTAVNDEMQSRNAELQQLNNDLNNLLSSVSIPIVMLGNDLRIRRFTPQAERILSLLPTDVGRPISDFRLKIAVPDLVSLCHEVIDTLAPRDREVQDAEGRFYTMWARPYRTSDNRIDGVVLALLDITDRKQATEARYRRLFEAFKDGLVIADAASGEIVDANPSVTKMFGFPRSHLVGLKFWESEIFAGSEIDESALSGLSDGESSQKNVSLIAESGERIEAEVVVALYTEGDRKVVQFNIRDITARRRMEERVHRSEDQLRQAQKMEAVGRLAGGVAHDFNNLLTAVLGYTDLLADMLDTNGAAREMVEHIRVGADRATALTRQLLAFGRKQIANPTVVDPNNVITEMQQIASVMLRENLRLDLNLSPDVARVRVDRSQLEQVVLNLVLNARDAIPAAGTITIETANSDVDEGFSERHPVVPVGSYVSITVKDTGTGMDEETKAHLFEPFFTTKPKGSGVGLGLATAYNIVQQSGGYVMAYSELGIGSTFTVYLPRVEGHADTPKTEPVQLESARGTETILLVEDEDAVRSLARRFLEAQGYRVLSAANGPEALTISRQHKGPIELMVTDVVMPRMSGRELAFQLASERPEMKVLYMSGHTEDAIIHHGVLEQGLAFLQKPFTRQILVARVRRLLDSAASAGQPRAASPVDGSDAR